MINIIKSLVKSEEGQAVTEYGLIVAIMAMGIVMALIAFQMQIAEFIANASEIVSDSAASVLPTAP